MDLVGGILDKCLKYMGEANLNYIYVVYQPKYTDKIFLRPSRHCARWFNLMLKVYSLLYVRSITTSFM